MEIYLPTLLSRKLAIYLSGFSRTKLKQLADNKVIRTTKTKGGHSRYFRDDIINYLNEHCKKQPIN